MVPLSVLDLCPIIEGGDAGQSLANTLDLARHAEALGFRRYWLAEHHNMPGIASAATAVVIGHVAAGTSTIRVGAGGVMLPNHAPLVIAEQFGTLEALYPGRIDLGLGRAPGTDQLTAQRPSPRPWRAASTPSRRTCSSCRHYFEPVQAGQAVRAVPGAGLDVPLWILGSSLYGAQLAAALGLPYAFASHFAPDQLMQAIDLYRRTFRPSEQLDRPYVMLGRQRVRRRHRRRRRACSPPRVQQAFVNLRRGGAGPLRPPLSTAISKACRARIGPCSTTPCRAHVIGSPPTIRAGLSAFVERTGADELIVTAQIYDHAARKRSYALLAEVRDSLKTSAPGA